MRKSKIDTYGEPFPLAPEAVHQTGRAPLLVAHRERSCQSADNLLKPYSYKAVGYSSSCRESLHLGLRLSVVTMPCKFRFIARHPLGFPSISVSHSSFDGTLSTDYVTGDSPVDTMISARNGEDLVATVPELGLVM
ncbi:hypothetical protein Acr_28g0009400 [Actinidia rufa]|uniref:Uncharacterized protein n=1 Tax=Actinidia rufa TaxID=165716 RepID=A0A7J0HB87_9ERIC|nr:hypothetical protein Acr_28g0009400 [Actinidia rufa]